MTEALPGMVVWYDGGCGMVVWWDEAGRCCDEIRGTIRRSFCLFIYPMGESVMLGLGRYGTGHWTLVTFSSTLWSILSNRTACWVLRC